MIRILRYINPKIRIQRSHTILFQIRAGSTSFGRHSRYFTDEYYKQLPRLPKEPNSLMNPNCMIFNGLIIAPAALCASDNETKIR